MSRFRRECECCQREGTTVELRSDVPAISIYWVCAKCAEAIRRLTQAPVSNVSLATEVCDAIQKALLDTP